MKDPYKILEVSRNATDEEIKSAYLEMVKKFHPDNYANNPLSELANEKMQEINCAYDEITNERKANGNSSRRRGNNSSGYQDSSSYSSNSEFSEIRNLINKRQITQAEEALDNIPEQKRTPEWYFLKGSVFYQRGWLDEALNHFRIATEKSPGNSEYQAAYSRLYNQRSGNVYGNQGQQAYRTNRNNGGGCSSCDFCSSLICADCCCECMGGDLISCC